MVPAQPPTVMEMETIKGSQRLPLITTDCMTTDPPVLTGLRQEVVAPVLGPAGFGLLGADWALLAVGNDGDAARLDPLRHEVVHGRLGALLTQRQVVLGRAPLVTVAFDQHKVVRVRLEPGGIAVENLGIARPNIVLVEIEVDRLEIRIRSELARPYHRRRGGSRRRGRGCRRRRCGRRSGRSRGGRWRCWGRGYGDRSGGARLGPPPGTKGREEREPSQPRRPRVGCSTAPAAPRS